LALCARTAASSTETESIRGLVDQAIDWKRFAALARRHKVMPLVFWTLSRTCRDAVPPAVLDELQSHFRRNTQLNLWLAAELKRLMTEISAAGIAAVPFKGLALSAAFYGNVALREAGDIDLLVRRADMPAVGSILRRLRYVPDAPRSEADDQALLDSPACYHLVFKHPDTGITVEPHWGLMPRFYSAALDDFVSDCWNRLTTQDLLGTAIPAVADEDLPLLLAVHAGKHLWEQLNWLCDLNELARSRANLDWNRALLTARATGHTRALALGLTLAADILQAPIPAQILERAGADRATRRLESDVRSWLFRDDTTPGPGTFARHSFFLRSMDRQRDRLAWAWHHRPSICQ
jgi:hypothetical protein